MGAGAGSGSFVRKAGGWSYSEKEGETGTAGEEAVQLTNAQKTETRRQILIRTGIGQEKKG